MKIWISALALVSLSAWAGDSTTPIGDIAPSVIFSPTSTDLSMDFLRNTFGSVGDALAGTNTQILGKLFSIFNYAVLAFAGSWISYVILTNTLNAAQGAGPAGKQINLWMHIRATLGLAMLVPLNSGYSWIQVITMTAVVQGVGFADTLWSGALDQLRINQGHIYQPTYYYSANDPISQAKKWLTANTNTGTLFTDGVSQSSTAHIDDMFASALCAAMLQKQEETNFASYQTLSDTSDLDTETPTSESWGVYYGSDCADSTDASVCFGSSSNATKCGHFTLTASTSTNETSTQLLQGFLYNMAGPLWDLAQQVIESSFDVDDTTTIETCEDGCTTSTTLSALAATSQAMLSELPTTPTGDLDAYDPDTQTDLDWIESAKQLGWIHAGAYYLNILGFGDMLTSTDVTYTLGYASGRSALVSDLSATLYTTYTALLGAIKNEVAAALVTLGADENLQSIAESSFSATSSSMNSDGSLNDTSLSTSTYQRMNNTLSLALSNILSVIWSPPLGSASEDSLFQNSGNDFATYSLTVVQDNLYAMLARVISAMVGLDGVNNDNLFNLGGSSSWTWDDLMSDTACSSDAVKEACGGTGNAVLTSLTNDGQCVTESTADCGSKTTCKSTATIGNAYFCGCDGALWSGCGTAAATGNPYPDACGYDESPDPSTKLYADQCNDNFPSSGDILDCFPQTATDIDGNTTGDSYDTSDITETVTFNGVDYTYTRLGGCSYYTIPRGISGKIAEISCTPLSTSLANCTSDQSGCYDTAVTEGCILPGYGLMGTLYSLSQGNSVDPITYLATFGMTTMDTSLAFLDSTLQGVINTGMALVITYTGKATLWSILFNAVGFAGKMIGNKKGGDSIGTNAMQQTAKLGGMISNIYNIMFSFDMTALLLFMPFATVMAATLFTLGATLGIYVPFIPFLIFGLAVIGWLMLVVESMVAAPLIAVSLTHPSGHDLLGRSEQAIILLFGVFIRPAAIIMGFTMALTLCYIAMQLVNYSFIIVLSNFLTYTIDTNADNVIQLIGTVGVLLVYAYAMVDVINQVFSLTYLVPQKLLRWIGGTPESGGMIQSILGAVQAKFGQAASSVGSSMGRSVASANVISPQALVDKNAFMSLKAGPQKFAPKKKGEEGDGGETDEDGDTWYDAVEQPEEQDDGHHEDDGRHEEEGARNKTLEGRMTDEGGGGGGRDGSDGGGAGGGGQDDIDAQRSTEEERLGTDGATAFEGHIADSDAEDDAVAEQTRISKAHDDAASGSEGDNSPAKPTFGKAMGDALGSSMVGLLKSTFTFDPDPMGGGAEPGQSGGGTQPHTPRTPDPVAEMKPTQAMQDSFSAMQQVANTFSGANIPQEVVNIRDLLDEASKPNVGMQALNTTAMSAQIEALQGSHGAEAEALRSQLTKFTNATKRARKQQTDGGGAGGGGGS